MMKKTVFRQLGRVQGRQSQKIMALLLAAAILLTVSPQQDIAAQTGGVWTSPANISESSGSSLWPWLVADASGVVHLFWAEDVEGYFERSRPQAGNAIMYRRWRDGQWEEPRDVLVSPGDDYVSAPVAAIDSHGVLHIVWSCNQGIYYSNVDSRVAENPRAWIPLTRLALQGPSDIYPATIAVDQNDVIHVLYATRQAGSEVEHISSEDQGATWSRATAVSVAMPLLSDEVLVSGSLVLHIDSIGRLHAGWTMYDTRGFGQAVIYAQSSDKGETWSTPFVVDTKREDDYAASWLTVATTDPQYVHLVWVGRYSTPTRSYRFSADGGLNWDNVQPVMEGYRGSNRALSMAVDSAGVLHLFSSARSAGNDTTVRYTRWHNGTWSPVEAIDPVYGGQHAVTAVVVGGNHLFAAWEDLITGEIMLAEAWVDAPAMPFTSFPEQIPPVEEVRYATATVTPEEVVVETVAAQPARDKQIERADVSQVMLLGVLPVIVIVAMTILISLRRR